MAVIRLPDKVFSGDFSDVVAPVSGDNGKALIWNQTAQRAEWVSVAASPGGSSGQVQYNSSGGFAGHSGFTYDGAGQLTVSSRVIAPVLSTDGTNEKYHRNVLVFYQASGTGTLVIVLPKLKSSTMVSMTIRGFQYSANNSADWSLDLSFYNYTSGFFARGCAQRGTGAPFTSVRLGNNGVNDVILLGTTSTVWSYARIHVTDLAVSSSNVTGWHTGWSASIVASESGITTENTLTIEYAGKNVFSTIASSVPVSTDKTFNSIYQSVTQQYARFGIVDGGGGIPTRGAYIQGGYTDSILYYNLWLNPLGGNVGVGTIAPSRKLDVVVSTGGASTISNILGIAMIDSTASQAGSGAAIRAALKSSVQDDNDAGRLIWQIITPTHATFATRGKLTAYYTTTEQEAIRWDGDTGGAKLSFYGAAAVARQLLPTGASKTVDDVITFLQNLGLARQS